MAEEAPTSILAGIQKHRASLSLAPPSEEAPAGDVDEVAAAEAPPAEPAEPAEAAPDEPSEPVVAAPEEPPAETGTESPSEPEVQAAAETPDDVAHAIKLAGGDTVEALAAKLVQFNNGNSKLGRELKAKEARIKELEDARAAAAAPVTPAPAAPATAVASPAPPATATPDAEFETRVREHMSGDADARTAAYDYRRSETRIAQIVAVDPQSQMLIGELPTVVNRLNALVSRTDEGAKALGIAPAPAYEQDEIKAQIEKLQGKKESLERELRFERREAKDAVSTLRSRREKIEGHLRSEHVAAKDEADESAAFQAEQSKFAETHEREFKSLMAEMKLDGPEHEELRVRVWNAGLADLVTSPKHVEKAVADMRAFHKEYLSKEQGWLDKARKGVSAATAAAARAGARPEAPRGARAVATPVKDKAKPTDWQTSLRENTKKVFAGRA